ncbi:hypothetical protein [Paraburkholderia flava]|uniref:hypothetical protein n=1 Tax=Paraburkholderia flava TaxID=2547393 RepID=UPI001060671E|nr:hypothetical protein [Paraburkholderia flava]
MTSKRAKSRLAGELGRFVQQYARKAQAWEPNDRQYDHKLERKMKRLSAVDLSNLLTGAEEDASDQTPVESRPDSK